MNQEISDENLRPNWRDSKSYKPLLKLDRAGWAWKWLRRNPEYIALASERLSHTGYDTESRVLTVSATEEGTRWGLHFRGESRPPGKQCPPILAC